MKRYNKSSWVLATLLVLGWALLQYDFYHALTALGYSVRSLYTRLVFAWEKPENRQRATKVALRFLITSIGVTFANHFGFFAPWGISIGAALAPALFSASLQAQSRRIKKVLTQRRITRFLNRSIGLRGRGSTWVGEGEGIGYFLGTEVAWVTIAKYARILLGVEHGLGPNINGVLLTSLLASSQGYLDSGIAQLQQALHEAGKAGESLTDTLLLISSFLSTTSSSLTLAPWTSIKAIGYAGFGAELVLGYLLRRFWITPLRSRTERNTLVRPAERPNEATQEDKRNQPQGQDQEIVSPGYPQEQKDIQVQPAQEAQQVINNNL